MMSCHISQQLCQFAYTGVRQRASWHLGSRSLCRPRLAPIKATQGGKPPETKTTNTKMADVERMLTELNVDRATAKSLLALWKKSGVTTSDDLRKLFLKRGSQRSIAVATQFAIDASTALISWTSGKSLHATNGLGPFTIAAEFVCYTLAMYLSISAALDIFTLVAVVLATRRYSAGSAAFLASVQKLAGPETGLNVVDKARRAVVTVQVLSALDQILKQLKLKAGSQGPELDFLRDLGAFLVLTNAMERKGFNFESFGLSADEAADIAAEFAIADSNDDGQLDELEFRRLIAKTSPEGLDMTEDEIAAAFSVLDKNKDKSIDFPEFAAWWSNSKPGIVDEEVGG